MLFQRIYLNDEKAAWFDTYLHEDSPELLPGKKRAAVIVCPGGGYQYTSDREAEPMALAFAGMGYHAFVLRYSTDLKAVMPGPIKELAFTMAYIKEHAVEWFIDPDKIFVAGFSAGGHLAASLGVFWNSDGMLPEYKGRHDMIRPAGMILGYPVIDLKSTSTHLDIGIKGQPEYESIGFNMKHPAVKPEDIFVRDPKDGNTYINFEVAMNAYMFGGYATEEDIENYSLQRHVNEDTVPAFIWHGREDGLIFPRNSMLFAESLLAHDIPYELHIFGKGGHGLGLANEVTSNNPWEFCRECEPWIGLAGTWIKTIINQE